jgi:threonine dehydratase
MSLVTLADIERARDALQGIIHRTPLDLNRTFSQMANNEVYLKMENVQKTGSFKIRGAYNKIDNLSATEKSRGVIAASAGNHAQGVAYAAARAGLRSTIVMPEIAPLSKIVATRGYGAEVVLAGQVYDEAFRRAKELQCEQGSTFIHAFDDEQVIAGQGTIGLEILNDLSDVSTIVVPIGGGGLISGIAVAVKTIAPHVRVIGVQASGAPAMYLSKKAEQIVSTKDAVTVADGIAVKIPGAMTYDIIHRYVDEIVTVEDEEIATTILMLLERSKVIAEGAGAVSLAAILNGKIPGQGRKIVAVLSGGNIDVNLISRIIERGLAKAGRRVRLSMPVIDRPGALHKMLSIIADLRGNVISIHHDRVDANVPLGQAEVGLTLETRDNQHTHELLNTLKKEGYDVKVLGQTGE